MPASAARAFFGTPRALATSRRRSALRRLRRDDGGPRCRPPPVVASSPSNDDTRRKPPRRVVVIGGGLAGLGAMHHLSAHCEDAIVTLVEANRELGGRCGTVSAMRGLSFDHGASYVSAKPSDPKWKASPFARALRAAEKAGVAARWRGDVGVADADAATSRGDDVVMDEGSFEAFPPEKELFVGVPTMAALPLFIAETLARATKPEASHLGDDAAVGAPEYATNAFVQTLTEPQYPGGRWNLTARIRDGGAFIFTVVPIRPRWRGKRQSLRTFAVISLLPPLGFNPRPRCLSTPLLTPFDSTPTFARTDPRPSGHVWYKSIDADIVIVATSAPAAAILMPWRGLGSVDDVEVDDETFTGIVQGAAHGVEANACWTLCVAFEKSLGAFYLTLVPVRPRRRGERRSLRT